MLGRIPGSTCAHRFIDQVGHNPAIHNPGPAGHNDAADPNIPGAIGFTPGPLGHGDYAHEWAQRYPQWLLNRRPEPPPVREEPAIDLGKLHDQLRVQTGTVQTNEDVTKAIDAARGLIHSFDELPEDKKRAVVGMVFTLGKTGFGGLKELIGAVEQKDFDRAAEEMQHSIWFIQVGKRGQELVDAMRAKPQEKRTEREPLPKPQLFKRRAATPAILHPVKPRHGFGAIIWRNRTMLVEPLR